jgi:hypothetical protein
MKSKLVLTILVALIGSPSAFAKWKPSKGPYWKVVSMTSHGGYLYVCPEDKDVCILRTKDGETWEEWTNF